MWIQTILAVAVSNLAGASIADHDCAQKWKFIDSARRIIALEFDSIKQINEIGKRRSDKCKAMFDSLKSDRCKRKLEPLKIELQRHDSKIAAVKIANPDLSTANCATDITPDTGNFKFISNAPFEMIIMASSFGKAREIYSIHSPGSIEKIVYQKRDTIIDGKQTWAGAYTKAEKPLDSTANALLSASIKTNSLEGIAAYYSNDIFDGTQRYFILTQNQRSKKTYMNNFLPPELSNFMIDLHKCFKDSIHKEGFDVEEAAKTERDVYNAFGHSSKTMRKPPIKK